MINGKDKNGDRIWRFRRTDVLFVVGTGGMIYGFYIRDLPTVWAGFTITGAGYFARGNTKGEK